MLARCPKCGTVVANAKKTWRMYGRPDPRGNRIELVIGLFDCPKCKRPFREVLSKHKIKGRTKTKSYEAKKRQHESSHIIKDFQEAKLDYSVNRCPICGSVRSTASNSSIGEYLVCESCGLNFWPSTTASNHVKYNSMNTVNDFTEDVSPSVEVDVASLKQNMPAFLGSNLRVFLVHNAIEILILNGIAVFALLSLRDYDMTIGGGLWYLLGGMFLAVGVGFLLHQLMEEHYGYGPNDGVLILGAFTAPIFGLIFLVLPAWLSLLLWKNLGVWGGYVSGPHLVFNESIASSPLYAVGLIFIILAMPIGMLVIAAVISYNRDAQPVKSKIEVGELERKAIYLETKGDLNRAIELHVKAALVHPISKIGNECVHRYCRSAERLVCLSVLKGNISESITLVKKYQDKLRYLFTRYEELSKVDDLLDDVSRYDLEKVLGLSLEIDEVRELLERMKMNGELQLTKLSMDYGYEKKHLQILIEIAVRRGMLQGFFTRDKTIFLSRDSLRQKLSSRLIDQDG